MPGPEWADLDQCLPPTAKVQQRGWSQSESLLFTLSNRGSSSTIQDRRGKPSMGLLSYTPEKSYAYLFFIHSLSLQSEKYCIVIAHVETSMLFKVVLLLSTTLSTRHLTYFVYNSQVL